MRRSPHSTDDAERRNTDFPTPEILKHEQKETTMAPRNIEVKALFNADEFIELQQECAAADVTRSKLLRDLAKDWLADRKDKRSRRLEERPAYGQNMAMLLPPRMPRPRMHMRL
jgi:hypothetical protein